MRLRKANIPRPRGKQTFLELMKISSKIGQGQIAVGDTFCLREVDNAPLTSSRDPLQTITISGVASLKVVGYLKAFKYRPGATGRYPSGNGGQHQLPWNICVSTRRGYEASHTNCLLCTLKSQPKVVIALRKALSRCYSSQGYRNGQSASSKTSELDLN